MKYCSKCGTEINDDSNFCRSCGAPVSGKERMKADVLDQHVTQAPIKKWFEYQLIRDEKMLTPEQISFLKKGSVTGFGPFNIFVRRHWDIIVVSFGLNAASGVLAEMERTSLFDFIVVAGYILLLGYTFRHGRRLAWNRTAWPSFDAFIASEKKWYPWGWVGIILVVLSNVLGFILGLTAA